MKMNPYYPGSSIVHSDGNECAVIICKEKSCDPTDFATLAAGLQDACENRWAPSTDCSAFASHVSHIHIKSGYGISHQGSILTVGAKETMVSIRTWMLASWGV